MAQKLTEQFIRMQRLAGIITESQAKETITSLNKKTKENLREGKIADFAKTAIKGVENILKQNLVAASNALDELIDRGRITPEQAKQTLMDDNFRKEIKKVEMQRGNLAKYSNTAIWRKVSDWVNDNYPQN